ncbi:MAG TPA: hypothetical protein VLS27_05285, partial [Gammaproteobacteria bacterium]|nr:hypothetical protein [Gammaproteobacteria bacterium]
MPDDLEPQRRRCPVDLRQTGAILLGILLLLGENGALAQLSRLSEEVIRSFNMTYGKEATRRLNEWQKV